MVALLDKEVQTLRNANGDRQAIRELARIANALRPSNSGAYDGFEAALRSIQLTLAECPNPFYEHITFPIPEDYAKATLDGLAEPYRHVVTEAAKAFESAREG